MRSVHVRILSLFLVTGLIVDSSSTSCAAAAQNLPLIPRTQNSTSRFTEQAVVQALDAGFQGVRTLDSAGSQRVTQAAAGLTRRAPSLVPLFEELLKNNSRVESTDSTERREGFDLLVSLGIAIKWGPEDYGLSTANTARLRVIRHAISGLNLRSTSDQIAEAIQRIQTLTILVPEDVSLEDAFLTDFLADFNWPMALDIDDIAEDGVRVLEWIQRFRSADNRPLIFVQNDSLGRAYPSLDALSPEFLTREGLQYVKWEDWDHVARPGQLIWMNVKVPSTPYYSIKTEEEWRILMELWEQVKSGDAKVLLVDHSSYKTPGSFGRFPWGDSQHPLSTITQEIRFTSLESIARSRVPFVLNANSRSGERSPWDDMHFLFMPGEGITYTHLKEGDQLNTAQWAPSLVARRIETLWNVRGQTSAPFDTRPDSLESLFEITTPGDPAWTAHRANRDLFVNALLGPILDPEEERQAQEFRLIKTGNFYSWIVDENYIFLMRGISTALGGDVMRVMQRLIELGPEFGLSGILEEIRQRHEALQNQLKNSPGNATIIYFQRWVARVFHTRAYLRVLLERWWDWQARQNPSAPPELQTPDRTQEVFAPFFTKVNSVLTSRPDDPVHALSQLEGDLRAILEGLEPSMLQRHIIQHDKFRLAGRKMSLGHFVHGLAAVVHGERLISRDTGVIVAGILVDVARPTNALFAVSYGGAVYFYSSEGSRWSRIELTAEKETLSHTVLEKDAVIASFLESTLIHAFGTSAAQRAIVQKAPNRRPYKVAGPGTLAFDSVQLDLPKTRFTLWDFLPRVLERIDETIFRDRRYAVLVDRTDPDHYLFFLSTPRSVIVYDRSGELARYAKTDGVREIRRSLFLDTFLQYLLAQHVPWSILPIGSLTNHQKSPDGDVRVGATQGAQLVFYRNASIQIQSPDVRSGQSGTTYGWGPLMRVVDDQGDTLTEIARVGVNLLAMTGITDLSAAAGPVCLLYGNYFYIPNLVFQLYDQDLVSYELREAFGRPAMAGMRGLRRSKKIYNVVATSRQIPVRLAGRWISKALSVIVELGSHWERIAKHTPDLIHIPGIVSQAA